MPTVIETTEPLNSLLRGELSAVETYNQAIDKTKNLPVGGDLVRMRNEHQEAVNVLTEHVIQRGGQPAADSGAWGIFAQAVEGTAKFFGSKAALKVLKEGEEHGIKEYEEALQDPDVDPDCKIMISAELLPQQVAHVARLNNIMQSCSC